MPVTLADMSTPALRHRVRIRVQRVASLALGVASGIVAAVNIALVIGGWNAFTDGTFSMPPMLVFVVDAMQHTPIAAVAAVILAGTAGVSATTPPVDALPRRLPMVVAIVACCLIAAYYLIPALMIVAWIPFGVVGIFFSAT